MIESIEQNTMGQLPTTKVIGFLATTIMTKWVDTTRGIEYISKEKNDK